MCNVEKALLESEMISVNPLVKFFVASRFLYVILATWLSGLCGQVNTVAFGGSDLLNFSLQNVTNTGQLWVKLNDVH